MLENLDRKEMEELTKFRWRRKSESKMFLYPAWILYGLAILILLFTVFELVSVPNSAGNYEYEGYNIEVSEGDLEVNGDKLVKVEDNEVSNAYLFFLGLGILILCVGVGLGTYDDQKMKKEVRSISDKWVIIHKDEIESENK